MQDLVILIYKISRLTIRRIFIQPFDWLITYIVFYFNGVKFSTYRNNGWPRVNVSRGGQCIIGEGFHSNNRELWNPIGRFNKCSLIVASKGKLIIGKNVGISSTAIYCSHYIEIGDNVRIGGNVVIYDTDFHSLSPLHRLNSKEDFANTKTSPVKIGRNAFIGAHTSILKGVSIGKNSVVGACSVVTRNIPDNQVWAGNPAKMIRKL